MDLSYVNVTLAERAEMPQRAKAGDAGYDLRAYLPGENGKPLVVEIHPFERTLIPTGVRIELPAGTCGLVLSRSGLAVKNGVAVANAPGLVDSGYRGEVGVILENRSTRTYSVYHGDRIAQLVIVELPFVELQHVEELAPSERGTAGFGSTGL